MRTLESGYYRIFCEGTSLNGQPVNGIIQTNIHIFYLGETGRNSIEVGPYSKNFTYKSVASFDNVLNGPKYYYEIKLDSPMSIDISTNKGGNFVFDLLSGRDTVASSKNYLKKINIRLRFRRKVYFLASMNCKLLFLGSEEN